MAKMTPEQEAQYALRWGVARSDLGKDAQLAYDHVVEEQEQRARSATPAPTLDAEPARGQVTIPKRSAALITTLAILIGPGPGTLVVLLPYLITQLTPHPPNP